LTPVFSRRIDPQINVLGKPVDDFENFPEDDLMIFLSADASVGLSWSLPLQKALQGAQGVQGAQDPKGKGPTQACWQ